MRITLRNELKKSRLSVKKAAKRDKWLKENAGQVIK